MSKELDEHRLFVSRFYPYVYGYWKQAEPAPFEMATVHRLDPSLKDMTLAEVAARLKDEDWWRVGPFMLEAEATKIVKEFTIKGETAQLKWR